MSTGNWRLEEVGIGAMKYSEEQYLDSQFYGASEGESNYGAKISKVRKEHKCAYSGVVPGTPEHTIKPGEKAFVERCIYEGEGWCTAYTCLNCIDAWIDKFEQPGDR